MFLAEALIIKQRIPEVGGNSELAKQRILLEMDAGFLDVTWERRFGLTYTNDLPADCLWLTARIDWSQSTAVWECLVPGVRPFQFEEKSAFCIRVRAAKNPSTKVAAETRYLERLIDEMKASPAVCPKSKSKFRTEAKSCGVSGRGFERAWRTAIEATGATWDRPGRPKKS
jgi:hypothetical protein